jgi:REP element-mobilizing transposase RayT
MHYNTEKHHRRSIRLKGYDYSHSGLYFVTICTINQSSLFGKIVDKTMHLSKIGEIAKLLWCEIPNHFLNVKLGEFMVMPNHIHGIIQICNVRVGAGHAQPLQTPHNLGRGDACVAPTYHNKPTLATIVGSYKSAVSKHIRRSGFVEFAWQRNYFENIIRNDHSYQYIADYIINNPATWEKDRYNQKMFASTSK